MRLLLVILCGVMLSGCAKEKAAPAATDYARTLTATKIHFEFRHWPASGRPLVVTILDRLISELVAAGEGATEEQKLACFRRAVVALNKLSRREPSLIETDEREQLVDIGNHIAVAAGLEPKKYGDGEGPLSAGRDW
jgi:hypothetical protein